jgi:hypothetical protein
MLFNKLSLSILIIFFSITWVNADDFIPINDSVQSELKQAYINLNLSDVQIINKDSYYITNSCSSINLNRNLLFLTKKIPFSYCYPTWAVWTFTIPSDWTPGTDIYLDLNWFTLDNSILGNVNYKLNTSWKIFYKMIAEGDKVISSFDNSIPNSNEQAVNNLLDSLNSFKSSSFSTITPINFNQIISTADNLVIKSSDIISNSQITLVIYRELSANEDKVYPAINLHSARIVYTKKHFK